MARKGMAFSPISFLDDVLFAADQRCRFKATNAASAMAWQRKARRLLGECLGFLDQQIVPPAPRTVEVVDRGSYIRKKVIIRTGSKSHMPMYVLIPKDSPRPMPCVLALHGHGYGVKAIVGLWKDGRERLAPEGYQKDFACELARRGFLVVAPEISCFGERLGDYSGLERQQAPPGTCFNAATYAMMLGGSVVGMRVWDGMRAVDYIETFDEADISRLGVMGISGGGMHAFFSTALDLRINACVISGYFCDWRHSILSINHCACNFVPGLLRLGELSDLAGLIAPRPCLVEAGDKDDIFPISSVKWTVRRARKAWKAFDAASLLHTNYFEGPHEISGAKAYDFLAKYL